ncbi:sensor histidine kinase [Winogradskyella flava]|uniref:Histidine kinase n=1 Tax=Winogradskyella flava TaxID=1884876 RepID=A0A842ITE5_9FLAO|nr:histidine kinase [Winogradskyella flava]MBC2845429.1 histidine kinase [Winogradskyella flava]
MYKLLIITVFSCCFGLAQNPYSIQYSLDESLPTSNIYSAFEANNGYMWFATDVGVLRYDGYTFEHFNTDDGLGDNEVFKIFQDSKKRLWFLTLNGELSYFKDKQFFNTKNSGFLDKISNQKMLIDIFEDDNDSLHFLYRDGKIVVVDIELNTIQTSDTGIPSYSIWEKNNESFALTNGSILNLKTKTEVFFSPDMLSLSGYRYYLDDEHYYFSSKNNIYKFADNEFKKILQLKDSEIIFITKIDGNFWIGTQAGLYVSTNNSTVSYFKDDKVSSVFKDSAGNYWVTTLNNGIKYIPNIDLMSYDFNTEDLKIKAIEKDSKKKLWIGTDKGLYELYHGPNSQISRVAGVTNYIKRIRCYDDTVFTIGNNSIHSFKNDKKRTVAFGANDILIDDSHYILSSSVVFKFKKKDLNAINRDFTNTSFRALDKYKIFGKRTNVSMRTEHKRTYLGTSTGLHIYAHDTIKKVSSNKGELETSILDIYVDNETHRIITASNSKGITTIVNDKIETHITSVQGLNSNGCYAIEKISNNSYFVGTNKGLNKISIKDSSALVTNYNSILKLKNEKINAIELIDSMIFLATDKGLMSFNYNTANLKNNAPKLVLESVLINGLEKENLSTLSYNENDITLNYTGISFSDFGNLTYEYKFNNDKGWTVTNNRELNFKNLSHGSYDLSLRAKGNSGVFSDIKHIKFVVKPPFWQTLPFILLVLVVFFIATLFLVKQRIKKIQSRFALERKTLQTEQEKIALEKQMVVLEQKGLRLQMNPHFIFNALNTIKGYYSGGNITEANKYIAKFSRLLRLILENDQHLIPLDKEIEMLELYIKLIQLRYQNVFDYKIHASEAIVKEDTGIPPLLLQPIVENAIIHGLAPNSKKGYLEVIFTIESDQLVCKIIDSGIGFSNAKKKRKGSSEHNSRAIEITRERINFENNSKDENNFQIIDLKNPSGTEVIIKLPLTNLWN